jgi:hypothetical protein
VTGKARVSLKLDGYQAVEKDYAAADVRGTLGFTLTPLAAASSGSAGAAPAKSTAGSKGKVFISSAPAGAEIQVDGKTVGTTPKMIELPVGSHTLTIQQGQLTPQTRSIDIVDGQNKAQHFNL